MNGPPYGTFATCAILSPPVEDDGLVVALASVPVTVQVTDPDTLPAALVVTVNGNAAVLDAQGTGTVEQDLVEGPNTLLLEANDPENHRCSARRQVVRDTTGPTLEVTTADGADIGNDFQTGETPLVLHILARDANGPADVAVTARGVAVDDLVGPVDDVYTPTIILADGNNPIVATATGPAAIAPSTPSRSFSTARIPS